jgi:hypothetical protein
VLTITGKPVQAWTQPVTEQQNRTNTSDPHSEAHNLNCQGIVANLEQVSAPNFGKPGSAAQLKRNLPSGLLARLEETSKAPNPGKPRLAAQLNRNVPSWCRGLQHPNVSECGDVHMPSSSAKSNIVLGPPVRAHPPRMRNLKMALFH